MKRRLTRRVGLIVVSVTLVAALVWLAMPMTVSADVIVNAETAGFGAAFAYAQNIANVSFTQAGSIGNGWADSVAFNGSSFAESFTWTGGQGAGFAQSIGTPFGSGAALQLVSFGDGFAIGKAIAFP